MAQTVFANGRGIDHKGANGLSPVFPDVCLTPVPVAGTIPIPYCNIGKSGDTDKGPKKVKIDGEMPMTEGATYKRTSGDEPGSSKGIISGQQMKEAEYLLYSFDVKLEGKGACRLGDMLWHNKKNIVG